MSGPTASGKSDFAIKLAKSINGSIINGDSIQCYKFFDLGSSKPTLDENDKIDSVDHYLYSQFDPTIEINAALYSKLLHDKINFLFEKGRVPIIVGGSGFYLHAFISGLRDNQIKGKASQQSSSNEQDYSYEKLMLVDELSAQKISSNDNYRIKRALEYFYQTGEKFSEFNSTLRGQNQYESLFIVFSPLREKLYQRINQRVDYMVSKGLFAEVAKLMLCYGSKVPPFKGIGYSEILSFFEEIDINEVNKLACLWDFDIGLVDESKYLDLLYNLYTRYERLVVVVDKIKQSTRNYAKRQSTFWRNQPKRFGWFDINEICATDGLNKPSSNSDVFLKSGSSKQTQSSSKSFLHQDKLLEVFLNFDKNNLTNDISNVTDLEKLNDEVLVEKDINFEITNELDTFEIIDNFLSSPNNNRSFVVRVNL